MSEFEGKLGKPCARTEFFSVWHQTDMPIALRNVRSQGQSGKHMLSLSFSVFDPNESLDAWNEGVLHAAGQGWNI
jgi:hypothetical protein